MTVLTNRPTPPRMLCVWFPDWPIQRLRRQDPRLIGKPIALSLGDGRTERIVACSAEARRLGVEVGQRSPDAQALTGPDRLSLLPYRPGDDRRELERLAAGFDRFSPVVALDSTETPDALLLEATNLAPLWADTPTAGERRLTRAVADWIQAERLTARLAVASTVGLALALARYGEADQPIVLPAKSTRSAASLLPIIALRVDDRTLDTLTELGFETIGQLTALLRCSLPSRFGPQLAERLDQLLGSVAEPIHSFHAEPPLVGRWDFETAVKSSRCIEHAVEQLLTRLSTAMIRRRVGALRVLIRYLLDAPAGETVSEAIALRLFRPTNAARELIELAALQAEGLRLRYAVRSIQAVVGSSTTIVSRQRTLFDDDARDDPHQLALLINRLASRVGSDRVSRVEKRRSVDPQRTYAFLPAIDVPAAPFRQTSTEAERARQLPLLIWGDDGEALSVETSPIGNPCWVVLPPRRRVVRCWGPERIETGWWRHGRHAVTARDAYWVELETGQRLWLCHDRRDRRWRLAGEFA